MSTTTPEYDPFPKHHLPDVTNENDMEWDQMRSPSGKFHVYEREMSFLMRQGADEEREQPPFEVAMVRVPPGAINWPRHIHLTQWEYYIVLAGEGMVRRNDEERPVRAGDHIMQPPGVAHHIVNTGNEDLVYYVIANNPRVDACYYPDSDKWGIHTARGLVRFSKPTTYWDGEDSPELDRASG